MLGKIKEIRENLQLEQIKKAAKISVVIFLIGYVLYLIFRCVNISFLDNICFVAIMILGMIFVPICVYVILGGVSKGAMIDYDEEEERIREKFQLKAYERKEILFVPKYASENEQMEICLRHEKKLGIRYFACLQPDEKKIDIIVKHGGKIIDKIECNNWLYLDANFIPQDEKTE